jgi:hypothetical protein
MSKEKIVKTVRIESETGEFFCNLDLTKEDMMFLVNYGIDLLKKEGKQPSLPLSEDDVIELLQSSIVNILEDTFKKENSKGE